MKTNSFENDPVAQKSRSDSNFKAMQLLKDTELSLQAAHNRIRVLQTQELRNQSKAEQTLTLLQRLQQVREAEQAHLSVVNSRQLQLQQHRQEQVLRSQHIRAQHEANREHSQEHLKSQRKQQYLAVEEQSQQTEENIAHSRLLDHSEKKKQCQQAGEQQEEVRRRLIRFHEDKQTRLKEQKLQEVQRLRQREQLSRSRVEALGKMEMQLLARQSASKAAYLQVREKLDEELRAKPGRDNLVRQNRSDIQANKENLRGAVLS